MLLFKIFCLSPLYILEPYNLTSSSVSYRSFQWTGALKSTPPAYLLNITKFSSFLTTGLNWPCYLLKIQMALSITAIFFQIWIPRITSPFHQYVLHFFLSSTLIFSKNLLWSNWVIVRCVVPRRCWVIPANSHILGQKFTKVKVNIWCFFAASLLIICKSLQIALLFTLLYYQSAIYHYCNISETIDL